MASAVHTANPGVGQVYTLGGVCQFVLHSKMSRDIFCIQLDAILSTSNFGQIFVSC